MPFKQKNKWRKLAILAHCKKFKRCAKAHKRNGGGFGCELGLTKECVVNTFKMECEDSTHKQRHEAIEASQEQMLATMFMCNADQDCHGELMVDLKNEFSPKVDNYPSTLDEAHHKLVNCTPKHPKQDARWPPDRPNPNRQNDNRDNHDGQGGHEIAFHGCQQVGHHRSQCPNNGPTGTGSGTASGMNADAEVQLLMNAKFADLSFPNASHTPCHKE